MRHGSHRHVAVRTGRAAFSLVELLVAIAVISLLTAILAPLLGRARELAREAVCLSRLGQFGRALNLYTTEHNDKYWTFRSTDEGYWYTKMAPYLGYSDDLLICPTAAEVEPGSNGWGAAKEAWGPVWLDDPAFIKYGSFGLNLWLTPHHPVESKFYGQFVPYEDWFWKSPAMTDCEAPTLLDCNYVGSWPFDNDIPPTNLKAGWTGHTVGGDKFMGRFCIDRHFFHVQSAFADCSARKIRLPDLWLLKWSRGFSPCEVKIQEP